MARRHSEGNVKRHPERMWRICTCGEEAGKVVQGLTIKSSDTNNYLCDQFDISIHGTVWLDIAIWLIYNYFRYIMSYYIKICLSKNIRKIVWCNLWDLSVKIWSWLYDRGRGDGTRRVKHNGSFIFLFSLKIGRKIWIGFTRSYGVRRKMLMWWHQKLGGKYE